MLGSEIRSTFLRFFEEHGHRVVPSSSLIPSVPGLLLANAGMNQFVPYFLGHEQPPSPRATSAQKCMRTPDIESVGHDARHLTFFEMLGNFSFGDYFKREAITWAHELVTERYGIDHDRLWVTVFDSDDDSYRIWADEAGVPPERIVRRGRFDANGEPANFWWMHAAGPCGPCSEIYVDRGPAYGPEGGPDVDEERFLEIWNLVFMQDECDEHSNVVRELPRKNIDTGSSLERVAVVLQDVGSVFETDLFRPILETAERLTGRRYGADPRADVSLRIIAEHARATTFMIADGVLPSNEGRGYVLRRMLRRLITHGRRLGVEAPVAGALAETVIDGFGEAYPELLQNRAFVLQVAASEEEHFAATYRQGMQLLEQEIATAKDAGATALSGDVAFRLHDTFGFQEQLTIELALEEGLAVDTERFGELMDQQRARAREAVKRGEFADAALADVAQAAGPSEFVGYQHLDAEARIVGVVRDGERTEAAPEGAKVRLVLERTPFYAEGGGQLGDAGTIRTDDGVLRVSSTKPGPGGTIVHEGVVERGELRQGTLAEAVVDEDRRAATARSHTATHVLHHTLRTFLGEHARQAGSLVAPGRLRFDFTHYEAVPRDALEEVEYLANRRLAEDSPVRAYETTYDFARSQGAMALFGEKYGDIVRVVEVGDYSVELCGGTHVHHTGEVALLRLVSEGSIGAGFRRVEALVGPDALKQVNVERRLLEEVMEAIGAGEPAQTPERVRAAIGRIKQLESELGKLRKADQAGEAETLVGKAVSLDGGVKLVVERVDGVPESELRELAARVGSRLAGSDQRAAVVLGTAGERGARLVASVSGGLASRLSARALLEPAARAIGGGAGGKDTLAMAGGPKADALEEALGTVAPHLASLLAGA